MRWRSSRQSSNIEDRRGYSMRRGTPVRLPSGLGMSRRGGVRTGGFGITTVIILLVGAWLLGINPLEMLGAVGGGAHAAHEFIDLQHFAGRIALVALILTAPPLAIRGRRPGDDGSPC